MNEIAPGTPGDPAFDALAVQLEHGYELAVIGELEAAEAKLRDVHSAALAAEFHSIAARSLIHLAYVSDQRGSFVHSQRILRECLAYCEQHGYHPDAAAAHYGLARGLVILGDLDQAEAELGKALMKAKVADRPIREADVYFQLGECRIRRGLLADALEYFRSAAELYQEHDQVLMLMHSLLCVHDAAFKLGRDGEADEAFRAAEQLCGEAGTDRVLSAGYARQAALHLILGDVAAAEACLDKCAAYYEAKHDYDEELEIELARAMYALATGRLGEALERYGRAKRIAQKMHNRFRLAEIRLEHAKALIAYGRLEHAQAVLLDTELAFELFGARAMLARCQCCWANYYAIAGNSAATESALQRALQLIRELGSEAGRLLVHEFEQAQARFGGAGAESGSMEPETGCAAGKII